MEYQGKAIAIGISGKQVFLVLDNGCLLGGNFDVDKLTAKFPEMPVVKIEKIQEGGYMDIQNKMRLEDLISESLKPGGNAELSKEAITKVAMEIKMIYDSFVKAGFTQKQAMDLLGLLFVQSRLGQ